MQVKMKCKQRWHESEDKVSVKLKCQRSWSVGEDEVREIEVSEEEKSKVEV